MRNDVRLRPIHERDLDQILRWITRSDVADALVLTHEVTPESQAAWFDTYREDPSKEVFAIEVSGRHVGNVSLLHIDRAHARARVSIFIGPEELRGQGIGSAAMRLVFDQAFGQMGLEKLSVEVLAANAQAIACYAKAGMQREGVLRGHVRLHGERRDMILMSILAPDRAISPPSAGSDTGEAPGAHG